MYKVLCFHFNGTDYVAIVNVNTKADGVVEAVELRRIYKYARALKGYIFTSPDVLNKQNVLDLLNSYPLFDNNNTVGFISDYNEHASISEDKPLFLTSDAESDCLTVDEPRLLDVRP